MSDTDTSTKTDLNGSLLTQHLTTSSVLHAERIETSQPPKMSEADTSSTRTDLDGSLLLKLPAELRVHVYRYVVVKKHPIVIGRCRRGSNPHILPGSQALRAACRQIRHEASPVHYSENKFKTVSTKGAEMWLRGLNKEDIKCIKDVQLFAVESILMMGPCDEPDWRRMVRGAVKRVVDSEGKGVLRTEAVMIPLQVKDGSVLVPTTELGQYEKEEAGPPPSGFRWLDWYCFRLKGTFRRISDV